MPETEMFEGGNSSKRVPIESILSCSSLMVPMQRARLRGEFFSFVYAPRASPTCPLESSPF